MFAHRLQRVSAYTLSITTSFLLSACTNALAPAGDIEIQPESTAFSRTPQGIAEVSYTVRNGGDDTVLLTAPCGDRLNAVIERRVADRWEQYSGGFCQLSSTQSPVPLTPGAQRKDVSVINEPGMYRLVLSTERGPVVSQAFAIR